ncbi:uncharacterized protein LOC118152803 [Callithrix jacchus]
MQKCERRMSQVQEMVSAKVLRWQCVCFEFKDKEYIVHHSSCLTSLSNVVLLKGTCILDRVGILTEDVTTLGKRVQWFDEKWAVTEKFASRTQRAGWGLRVYLCKKLPDDAAAAGQGSTIIENFLAARAGGGNAELRCRGEDQAGAEGAAETATARALRRAAAAAAAAATVLETLRERLLSVQQDFTSRLKTLSDKSREAKVKSKPKTIPYLPKHSAGLELLSRYEDTWAALHRRAKECAGARELVDSEVVMLSAHWEKKKTSLVELQEQLQQLPALIADLESMMANLTHLEASFEEIENNNLLHLEDLCGQCEFERCKHMQSQQLENYKKNKRKMFRVGSLQANVILPSLHEDCLFILQKQLKTNQRLSSWQREETQPYSAVNAGVGRLVYDSLTGCRCGG